MSTNILGVSAYYHDSAACLVRDGRIVAAVQEERFTRKKFDARFPVNAIRYCLEEGGISLADLKYFVFYDKPLIKFERLLETYVAFSPKGIKSFLAAMPVWLKEKLVTAGEQIPMQVDRRLRPTGRAGRVEPERHVVAAHRLGRQLGGRLRQQRGQISAAGTGRDHRAQVRYVDEQGPQPVQQRRVADQHPGPAVAQHRGPGRRVEARVERHRHRADAEYAQKGRRPLEPVGQHQRHALLGLDTERAERVAGAGSEREELTICRRAGRGDEGGLLAGWAVGRCVEEREHCVAHGESLAEQPVAQK
jgi:hypothetical protein